MANGKLTKNQLAARPAQGSIDKNLSLFYFSLDIKFKKSKCMYIGFDVYDIFGINATPPGCRGSAMSHVLFAMTSYESGMTQISGQASV